MQDAGAGFGEQSRSEALGDDVEGAADVDVMMKAYSSSLVCQISSCPTLWPAVPARFAMPESLVSPPKPDLVAERKAATEAREVMLTSRVKSDEAWWVGMAAVSSPRASPEMSQTPMEAPWLRSVSAVARPMPEAAPMTA